MTSLRTGNIPCPICHRTATVKPVAAVHTYASHQSDQRFAPPVQQVESSLLLWPITWGVIIETVTLISVMVLCATGNFSIWQYWLAVVGICLPLLLSAYAFRRMLGMEKHSQVQRTWDEARANWGRLLYCSADDLLFDPITNDAARSERSLPDPDSTTPVAAAWEVLQTSK
jgi:hypothetical protein